MVPEDFLDIPGEVVETAERASSFKLTVPEDARANRRDPKMKYWTEEGKIVSSSSKTYTSGEGESAQTSVAYRLDITITNGCYDLNTGQTISAFIRINYSSLRSKLPEGQYKMSLLSIGKLKQLFIALGIDPDLPNGGYSGELLRNYFPEETEFPAASPLAGEVLTFEVKQGPRKLDDGSIKESPEVNKFHSAS